jgi:hypothetical protein
MVTRDEVEEYIRSLELPMENILECQCLHWQYLFQGGRVDRVTEKWSMLTARSLVK